MPVVFRHRGYKFYFYSAEGNPREPVHIHVKVGDVDVKFWVRPDVRLAYNDGVALRTVRELKTIVEANTDRIERFWNEYFG